jgi:hypothetical protein
MGRALPYRMTRKAPKKLLLGRESVALLTHDELRLVGGGIEAPAPVPSTSVIIRPRPPTAACPSVAYTCTYGCTY